MNSNVNVAFTNSDGTAMDSIQVLKNDLTFTGIIERDFFFNPALNKYLMGNGRMGDYLDLNDWGEINQDNPDTKSTYVIGEDELGEGVEDIRDSFLQEKPSEVVGVVGQDGSIYYHAFSGVIISVVEIFNANRMLDYHPRHHNWTETIKAIVINNANLGLDHFIGSEVDNDQVKSVKCPFTIKKVYFFKGSKVFEESTDTVPSDDDQNMSILFSAYDLVEYTIIFQ